MRLPYCEVIAILQGDCIEEILKLSGGNAFMIWRRWYKTKCTISSLLTIFKGSKIARRTITAANCLRIIPLVPSCFTLLHCSSKLSCVRYGLNFYPPLSSHGISICSVPSVIRSTRTSLPFFIIVQSKYSFFSTKIQFFPSLHNTRILYLSRTKWFTMIRFTRKVATTYQRNTKRSIATDMYRSNIHIYIYRSISFIHHKEARGTRFSFGSIHHVALCRSTSCWYYTHNIVQVDGYTGTPIVRQILDPFILWGGGYVIIPVRFPEIGA